MVIGQTLTYISYIKVAIIIYSKYYRQKVYNMLVYSSRYHSHSNHDSISKMAQNNDLASDSSTASLDNERKPLLPQEKNGRYESSRKQNRGTADSSPDTSSDSSHSTL